MRLLTGIVIFSVAVALTGRQAVADTSALYTGRPINLGSCQSNFGYGQYCKKSSPWNVGFWTEAGIYANTRGTKLERNDTSPYFSHASGNGILLGNLQNPDFNMNQTGLFLERKMDTSCGFDWGFKTQMLFGTDAYITQSREDFWLDHDWRSGDYYTSISDLYLTAGYQKLGVKVGKFASPLTFEHVESPNNFFYSHSYGYLQGPATHSGVLLDYRHHCRLSFFGGWTMGSDAGWSNRFNDSAFLGGARYNLWKGGNLSYAMQYSDIHGGEYKNKFRPSKMAGFGVLLEPGQDMTAYYHSMVFTQDLGCRWDYAAEWYLMNGEVSNKQNIDDVTRYGICQYLTYQMTCKLGLGFRGEWMRIDDGYNANFYAMTFGANWTPVQCLMIRPEVRYGWHDDLGGAGWQMFNSSPGIGGQNREQLSLGIAAMYKF